jgi:hypothetical protein
MFLGKILIDGHYFHGKRDVEWDVAIQCGYSRVRTALRDFLMCIQTKISEKNFELPIVFLENTFKEECDIAT